MQKIMVAIDGSDQSFKALDLACDLSNLYSAELIAVHVVSENPMSDSERKLARTEYREDIKKTLKDIDETLVEMRVPFDVGRVMAGYSNIDFRIRQIIGSKLLESAEIKAREKDVKAFVKKVVEGDPVEELLKLTEVENVDTILLGSRGLGDFQGLLLGSVSHKISHMAKCTCITVR